MGVSSKISLLSMIFFSRGKNRFPFSDHASKRPMIHGRRLFRHSTANGEWPHQEAARIDRHAKNNGT